ncbi:hypothetical protein J3495_03630 [Flavobacterium sp. P7388]|uniref:Outer membrane protein/protective antigen OMA87 n=2 Tax=Flavobacterium geliluteum TaxID=2816120 RepID=A0A941AW48_9FLAO|nr:hypothetical protein [Flavobacterium geliluteum]MBP4137170.1 hypothetical protein [Flavobacterium geliluteum]
MFRNFKILFFILLCMYSNEVLSQEKDTKKEKDKTETYSEIKKRAKKIKAAKFFKKVIFRSPKSKTSQIPVIIKDTAKFEGKIIRKIRIVTLDPFGRSDTDSTVVPKNWGERNGNKFHLKTKKFAIQNLLLFKKNTPYNAYKVQESERIIRSQRYVSKVTISEELLTTTNDSIDITVRVLDAWSILPRFSISSSRVNAGFLDRNIFGTGQQLEYRFTNRFQDGRDGHDGTYTIPNIKNTFISTRVKYRIDLDNNYSKSIAIERPFYSPLTKYAGGIILGQRYQRDTLQAADLSFAYQNFKYNVHDFWIAKAFDVTSDNPKKERTTNLILATRLLDVDYVESPLPAYDSIQFFSDEKQMLLGFGLNTREFVRDNYIFRNGNPEDVPVGRIYGITLGYQYKNKIWRPYAGAQASFGDYFPWGFLSTNFEVGTYFHQSKTYQTAFSFQANYFTNLIEMGNWKLRQFIKPEFIIGVNRAGSMGDQLNINEDYGIQGFNTAIYGTSKMLLTLQTQTYAPNEILGFRINPFFNYSIAVLGNSNVGVLQNKYYQKLSLGLTINNDYLVFSSFQLSISYYPTIPNQGDNIFKTNTFQNSDFGMQSFGLGKPRIVEYK